MYSIGIRYTSVSVIFNELTIHVWVHIYIHITYITNVCVCVVLYCIFGTDDDIISVQFFNSIRVHFRHVFQLFFLFQYKKNIIFLACNNVKAINVVYLCSLKYTQTQSPIHTYNTCLCWFICICLQYIYADESKKVVQDFQIVIN